jgi:pSer/pThr/pTyr-binding forkhead associated (FHA) protein
VYAEGTRDEHTYAFEGDELKIGRARGPDPKTGMTNDIILSHDSLVARYCHARVYRHESCYYVENRSVAGGTLVDNDLVKQRRLLGGEEIVLGRSAFKFRFVD